MALEINDTPPTTRLQCLSQIFTVLERRFPLDRSIGLRQVVHHVSSLNKARLQRERRSQHRLVLVAIGPANGILRHSHLDRKPRMAARPADPFADHLIRQVPVGHWCPVVLATAIRAIHWGLVLVSMSVIKQWPTGRSDLEAYGYPTGHPLLWQCLQTCGSVPSSGLGMGASCEFVVRGLRQHLLI